MLHFDLLSKHYPIIKLTQIYSTISFNVLFVFVFPVLQSFVFAPSTTSHLFCAFSTSQSVVMRFYHPVCSYSSHRSHITRRTIWGPLIESSHIQCTCSGSELRFLFLFGWPHPESQLQSSAFSRGFYICRGEFWQAIFYCTRSFSEAQPGGIFLWLRKFCNKF